MRKTWITLFGVLAVTARLLAAWAPPATEPPPPPPAPPAAPPDLTGETITVYHFGDLSGPYAAITSPLVHGAEDAVAAINAAGGIYGATLEVEFADTAGS